MSDMPSLGEKSSNTAMSVVAAVSLVLRERPEVAEDPGAPPALATAEVAVSRRELFAFDPAQGTPPGRLSTQVFKPAIWDSMLLRNGR